MALGEEGGEGAGCDFGFGSVFNVGGVESQLCAAVEWLALCKGIIDECNEFFVGFLGNEWTLSARAREGKSQGKPLGRCGEIYCEAVADDVVHIVEIAGSATAASHDDVFKVGNLVQHATLKVAEAIFAALCEKLLHRGVEPALNVGVEVDKFLAEVSGKSLSESGLATAHISYEKNRLHKQKVEFANNDAVAPGLSAAKQPQKYEKKSFWHKISRFFVRVIQSGQYRKFRQSLRC